MVLTAGTIHKMK